MYLFNSLVIVSMTCALILISWNKKPLLSNKQFCPKEMKDPSKMFECQTFHMKLSFFQWTRPVMVYVVLMLLFFLLSRIAMVVFSDEHDTQYIELDFSL